MVVNIIIAVSVIAAGLFFFKVVRPYFKKKKLKKEKEQRELQRTEENLRKKNAFNSVLAFLSQEWTEVATIVEQLATSQGANTETFDTRTMFLGLDYGIGLRWVEKHAGKYRLTSLGAEKKEKRR